MTRPTFTLLIAAAASAWVSAQPPTAGPSAAEQLRQLQGNRQLLEQLLDRGVGLSDADTALGRAEKSRAAAAVLADALADAARGDRGPDRVAELGDHLTTFWETGLAPSLKAAAEAVPVGSPDRDKFEAVQKAAAADVAEVVKAGLPAAEIPAVRDTLEKLRRAGDRVGRAGE